MCFFFFKQKTAYDMRISDWSSDVCSSDLGRNRGKGEVGVIRCEPNEDNEGNQPNTHNKEAKNVREFVKALREEVKPDGVAYKEENRSEERSVGKECVSTCRSGW